MNTTQTPQNIISQKIGRNIRAMRKTRGFSRKDIGDYLNVSDISVYKYETGEVNISIDKLVYLMMYFECGFEDLLFGIVPVSKLETG
jgi:transcriptional regulator with XRE-family HTH domain